MLRHGGSRHPAPDGRQPHAFLCRADRSHRTGSSSDCGDTALVPRARQPVAGGSPHLATWQDRLAAWDRRCGSTHLAYTYGARFNGTPRTLVVARTACRIIHLVTRLDTYDVIA